LFLLVYNLSKVTIADYFALGDLKLVIHPFALLLQARTNPDVSGQVIRASESALSG
jgi:hypothetical protein